MEITKIQDNVRIINRKQDIANIIKQIVVYSDGSVKKKLARYQKSDLRNQYFI